MKDITGSSEVKKDAIIDNLKPQSLEKKQNETDVEKGDIKDIVLAATGDGSLIPSNYLDKAKNVFIFVNIISLAFSAAAFFFAIQANNIQKAQITAQMIAALGSREVTDGLVAVRSTIQRPPETRTEFDAFLKAVQPLKRNLEALGTCVELGSCSREFAHRFVCDEILSINAAMELAYNEVNNSLFEKNQFVGLTKQCEESENAQE